MGISVLLVDWTEKVEKRGLDPLGIQNSGVQLYQALVPGISNVTLRVRYLGLYCWASDAYAQEVASTGRDDWRDWIRRLEALQALIAVNAGTETGVAGVEWAERHLARAPDPIDFSDGASMREDADQYLTGAVGVYGQAYLSQLIELGLFGYAANHALPTRTERGLAGATAFRASIGPQLEQMLLACLRSAVVARETLASLQPVLPSKIPMGPERDFYEALLFADEKPISGADLSRRDTLLLILHAARAGSVRPPSREIRKRLFSNLHETPGALKPQRLRWEAYQAHDMWQVAAGALLMWSISIVGELDGGRSLPEIRAEIQDRLAEHWPDRLETPWRSFRAEIAGDDQAFDVRARRLTASGAADARGLAAVEQMGALDQRVRGRADLAGEITRSFLLGGGGRSIRSELAWLDPRQDQPIRQIVAALVEQRVVRRHSWVAIQKLRRQRDYTFLLEARDGRLAYRAQYQPVATTPRLDPAIQFLADIKLIDGSGCTELGRRRAEAGL